MDPEGGELETKDKVKVLKGKAWSFENQYLILREWTEDILEKIEEISKVDLWIQVWNLPYHWIGVDTGRKIGKKIGNVWDVFVPETGSYKGRYIKILVEVDLNKPLFRGTNMKLGLEVVWVDFRYENLQGFCCYCGRVRHLERGCMDKTEDLKYDRLREGQYGEWLKASNFNLGKQLTKITKIPPSGANERSRSPLNEIGEGSNNVEKQEGEPEERKNDDTSENIQNGSQEIISPPSGGGREELFGNKLSILGSSYLRKDDSLDLGEDKEIHMLIDNLEMAKVVVKKEGMRTPLSEIQNENKGEESQGVRKSTITRRVNRAKGIENRNVTPMDTSKTESSSVCGHKSCLEVCEEEQRQSEGDRKTRKRKVEKMKIRDAVKSRSSLPNYDPNSFEYRDDEFNIDGFFGEEERKKDEEHCERGGDSKNEDSEEDYEDSEFDMEDEDIEDGIWLSDGDDKMFNVNVDHDAEWLKQKFDNIEKPEGHDGLKGCESGEEDVVQTDANLDSCKDSDSENEEHKFPVFNPVELYNPTF
ncbi:hypothetical protein DH2020_049913 [Rehmannia glutinosa]|uniref:Zinc knuckle CX2CX4HX4C domain-containing protein n=1 Tax=Rehmannia glutinosa TaxID=99300 RepID=A0ABR0U1R7_REHGL